MCTHTWPISGLGDNLSLNTKVQEKSSRRDLGVSKMDVEVVAHDITMIYLFFWAYIFRMPHNILRDSPIVIEKMAASKALTFAMEFRTEIIVCEKLFGVMANWTAARVTGLGWFVLFFVVVFYLVLPVLVIRLDNTKAFNVNDLSQIEIARNVSWLFLVFIKPL